MKKVNYAWEILDDLEHSKTARCKVIGGWIVNHSFQHKGILSESMVFISDKDHEWYPLKPTPEPTPIKKEIPALLKSANKQAVSNE